MSNNKMKGLLKGLRYISQIFDNEKEQDMQIGFPTDVKHVAHIGWDGPSVNSPSWMNEFKSPQGFSSAPLGLTGEMKDDTNSAQKISEDPNRRNALGSNNSTARDLPELPKSSRRHSAGGSVDSPTKEKSERTRQRRSSKNSNRDSADSPKAPKPSRLSLDSSLGSESPSRNLGGPEIPKKTRRKKSKDTTGPGGTSSKTRIKAQSSEQQYQSPYSDPGPGPGPGPESQFGSKSNSNELYRQQQSFEGEEKGFT